ncbi:mercury methylation ferredoxin HgcB [Trichlorobacter ammonificans]|uniref:Ferredoxin n=1 Tax=Trichlorobacter ammonificans TaxID=2916410 RepID=A0ABM9D7H9_9BACT|nr:mercury methylation ferredoxin HgcB [Trichlorobacter ammonificans]CAH2030356.1 Ferredoxin [Trichlorobacter ammonificans]
MHDFRYLHNVVTLGLDRAACIGCGRCAEVCPHQVFAVSDRRASIIDRDGCMECGACARNCPARAIAVEAGVGCASGMINRWLQEHNLKGTSGGGCCS